MPEFSAPSRWPARARSTSQDVFLPPAESFSAPRDPFPVPFPVLRWGSDIPQSDFHIYTQISVPNEWKTSIHSSASSIFERRLHLPSQQLISSDLSHLAILQYYQSEFAIRALNILWQLVMTFTQGTSFSCYFSHQGSQWQ